MTLSHQGVMDLLRAQFACGWQNIKGKIAYAGSSNTHLPSYPAMEVSNCSGHHNVQMVFMTADGRVLHCLPGYWNPRHFLHEANLAIELAKLYYRKGLSAAERNDEYLNLHLRHALSHPVELQHSSDLQGFDKLNIEKRQKSDFHRKVAFTSSSVKTTDQVVHERLAERPFVPFSAFDVKRFIDMGLTQYKYDFGVPGKG